MGYFIPTIEAHADRTLYNVGPYEELLPTGRLADNDPDVAQADDAAGAAGDVPAAQRFIRWWWFRRKQRGSYWVPMRLATRIIDGQSRQVPVPYRLLAWVLYCQSNNLDPLTGSSNNP